MSAFDRIVGGLRRTVLLEDRVTRLEEGVRKLRDDSETHERRIQQIETVLFGPVSPDRLRLPRS